MCVEGLSQDTEKWSVVVISSLMVGAIPDSDDVKHSINYQKNSPVIQRKIFHKMGINKSYCFKKKSSISRVYTIKIWYHI